MSVRLSVRAAVFIVAMLVGLQAQATGDKPEWKPPVYYPPVMDDCREFRLEKATTTWDGKTGEWSEWVDWPNSGPRDWGVIPDPLTGHHGGSHGRDGDREFGYFLVDARPIEPVPEECLPPKERKKAEPIPSLGTIGLLLLIIIVAGIATYGYRRTEL